MPPEACYNLLMLSGDNSIARGVDGAFARMLARFSTYWERIDILTPSAPDATERVLYGNVHVHPATRHRALQPFFIVQKGRELMAQHDYALVTSHDFGFFYNGIGAYWLLRDSDVPYVSEIHHVEGYPQAVNLRERLWRWTANLYIPFAQKRVAGFRVVNYHDTPRVLHRLGVPKGQILVLPSLYIDHDVYQPLPDVEEQYDLLFVGRLSANKGIFTILEAVRLLHQNKPDITLAIRGEGVLRPQIDAYIQEHGLDSNIVWVPRTPDEAGMAQLYNQARMLVCASTVEGGPRVTIEAMACATAVLSTPVGIMPEVINDGDNGFIVRDAYQIASSAEWLLSDEVRRQAIAQAGHEAVQKFRADDVVAQYAQGYHDLIARWQAGTRWQKGTLHHEQA
jgi:glycosyltransferase involved in cell wall biosynthesis